MQEDEVLERITRLLEKGCTMLATHHECGAPLFRCQGEVVCPVCSYGRDREEPAAVSSPSANAVDSRPSDFQSPAAEDGVFLDRAAKSDLEPKITNLRGLLLSKAITIAEAIEVEQDLEKAKRQIDCIEALLRIFASLPR